MDADPTGVYFDCDGTLVEFIKPYGDIVADAVEALGVAFDSDLRERFDGCFFQAFEAFDPDPYRRAFDAAFAGTGHDVEPAHAADALVEAELDATRLREGTRETLERLRDRRDVRLGVLSNGVPRVQRAKLERHGIADLFETFVVSYDVGAHKPDPEIFAVAEERLQADRYVYVGDDYDGDIAPAREAGWLGVHVDRDTAAGIVTAHDITDVAEIGRLFG